MAFGQSSSASAVVMVGRTPIILASALKDASALRPTSTGLPSSFGLSTCSTEAKNESSDTCTTVGIGPVKLAAGIACKGSVDAVAREILTGSRAGNTDSTQALINAPGEDWA